jgi:hypothetical protein
MGTLLSSPEGEESFPFFQIFQWAMEDVETSRMFEYDLESVAENLRKIWMNDASFEAACEATPPLHFDLTVTRDTAEEVWISWASALLENEENLRELRFRLVPSRMSEKEFWQKIFSCIKTSIKNDY